MVQQINDYFTYDRSYRSGLILVMQFTQKMALKKQLNVQPFSAYLQGVIHEELRQLAGISHKEFEQMMLCTVLEKPAVDAFSRENVIQKENIAAEKKASRRK